MAVVTDEMRAWAAEHTPHLNVDLDTETWLNYEGYAPREVDLAALTPRQRSQWEAWMRYENVLTSIFRTGQAEIKSKDLTVTVDYLPKEG